ncbi:MAG: tRNA preQ1(34) S-adenosylmethionine ribosyltransferase-isomerase QueA [Ruminococcaceae bacterium]|nr:tRNA preQ1(34) S-adenosylmethionine ribosyltransferase-isomerase QueA [Oscillospiraceae bacterium]
MKLSDFDYTLPEELIAQEPLTDRTAARLLTLIGGKINHGTFTDLRDILKKGDCLVLNDTRVIPARLYGQKKDTGGAIEFLLLKRMDLNVWEVALRPGKKAKPGAKFVFGDILEAEILEVTEGGNRIVSFSYEGIFEEILDKLGEMPLPHYITKKLEDKEMYQTVFARERGSAAAPTAGLHFTEEFLDELRKIGVDTAFLTLHVGLGTFRPVKVEEITEHKMHTECYSVSEEAAAKINACKERGGRVVCCGTTSVRTVESVADENGRMRAQSGDTDIFIYPGYTFKAVDAIITNFHLPKSTLLMLISAFAGRENILRAYEEAVKERYRFFSFGDAMFLEN